MNSELRKVREARDKIGVNLWPDQQVQKYNPRCLTCISHQKLKLEGANWVCRECGTKTPVEQVRHEKKLTSKFPSSGSGNPMIISKKDKKQKRFDGYNSVNSDIDDETKNDIRAMGYNI